MKPARSLLVAVFVLAAPANSVAGGNLLVIGGWDYGETVFDRAATGVGMSAKFATTEDTEKVTVEQLKAADVVFLLNLKPDGAATLRERTAEAKKAKPGLLVLSLYDPCDDPIHFWRVRRSVPVVIPGFLFFAAVPGARGLDRVPDGWQNLTAPGALAGLVGFAVRRGRRCGEERLGGGPDPREPVALGGDPLLRAQVAHHRYVQRGVRQGCASTPARAG